MTTGAANTGNSGASSTKTLSTHESASKTDSAASETKTVGAAKVTELPGNVFVAIGAAIAGGLGTKSLIGSTFPLECYLIYCLE